MHLVFSYYTINDTTTIVKVISRSNRSSRIGQKNNFTPVYIFVVEMCQIGGK